MQKKYILIFVITLFFGCSKQDDDSNSKPSSNSNFGVTLDEAKLVAQNAISFLNPGNKNKKVLKRSVVSSTTATFNGKPSFHIFNYAEGGFAVISADKRSTPILAYSDEADYSFNEKDKPLGLVFWENTTKAHIESLQKEPSASISVLKTWDKVICPVDPQERTKSCPGDGGSGGGTQIFTNGPLLQTNWSQLCGYNNLTPTVNESWAWTQCYHMPTGCVATCMAQIMRYWQFPSSYNWSIMPNNSGSAETSRLMKDIGDGVHMDYQPHGSSAKASNIGGTLVGVFGYAQADFRQHYDDDYSAVVDNIRFSRPVILTGCDGRSLDNCHAWVCDGTQQIYSDGYGYLNFHMNWGWAGQGNGWFHFDNWPVTVQNTTYNFSYYQQMIANIHP